MKKTYIIPKLETIELKTAGMLALSNGDNVHNSKGGTEDYAPGFDWDDDFDEE